MVGNSQTKVICIMGPTASGKSRLALTLADQIPCEIISVDSALVYRNMDIGTAKPTIAELSKVPHHLIDICDPAEPYSAGQFCQDATTKIAEILTRGKTPILVGGTMLYFRALTTGLAKMPTSCPKIRARIDQQAEEKGWAYLHAELSKLDSAAAARIHPHDAQRIQRALEVYELTGRPLSEYHEGEDITKESQYRFIGLLPSDRSRLHEIIAQRFDLMLEQGFVAEVEALKQRGDLHADLPALRSVGYRQIWDYLAGKMSYEHMREKGIAATRQLAKRQLTWLRSWTNLETFDCFDSQHLSKIQTVITRN